MSLNGPAKAIMDASGDGMLVRQKLDALEQFCACLDKSNKYRVATVPPGFPVDGWDDQAFFGSTQTMTMKEESEFICRICLGGRREFKMHVTAGEATHTENGTQLFVMDRPFRCTLNFCCFQFFPQEITTSTAEGAVLGRVVQDWRCMPALCSKLYYKIENANQEVQYIVEDDTCCNSNMFAPSLCCPARRFNIYDASQTQIVGSIENRFSCALKRLCFSGLDQYKITYPTGCTAENKALILSQMTMLEYMLFERGSE